MKNLISFCEELITGIRREKFKIVACKLLTPNIWFIICLGVLLMFIKIKDTNYVNWQSVQEFSLYFLTGLTTLLVYFNVKFYAILIDEEHIRFKYLFWKRSFKIKNVVSFSFKELSKFSVQTDSYNRTVEYLYHIKLFGKNSEIIFSEKFQFSSGRYNEYASSKNFKKVIKFLEKNSVKNLETSDA
ncbi:MAG TPA: hypothetical protein VGE63_00365 [Candidatus Paceibacterota bacterium]